MPEIEDVMKFIDAYDSNTGLVNLNADAFLTLKGDTLEGGSGDANPRQRLVEEYRNAVQKRFFT